MKMMKGLLLAAATLMLSSVATAAPESDAAFTSFTMDQVQTANFNNVNQYCREYPSDCYCYFVFGREYCTIY